MGFQSSDECSLFSLRVWFSGFCINKGSKLKRENILGGYSIYLPTSLSSPLKLGYVDFYLILQNPLSSDVISKFSKPWLPLKTTP